jgi:ABC-type Fe3+-hydroxamate transport system substrate-binding protein
VCSVRFFSFNLPALFLKMTIRSFFDQLGNEVSYQFPPNRIISLVPSQTELLADLGLEQQVVGITRFCVHPSGWRRTKTIIGGTKNFQFDTIDALKPDLIIGNKEENYLDGITRLKQQYPVWLSDIVSLQDAYAMINSLGAMTDTERKASQIKHEIALRLSSVKKSLAQSVLYLIWRQPWMAVGTGTFIDSMLTVLNLKNVLVDFPRYPELSAEQIADLNPQLVFLSSEPYPFREKHIKELKALIPSSKVVLVDGEMFSWYGSRLLKTADYFNRLNV